MALQEVRENSQYIFHYKKLGDVDQTAFADILDPIIVLNENDNGQHEQIKVLPFNTLNTDKEELSFADKIQYFQRSLRRAYGGSLQSLLVANTAVVMEHVFEYVDSTLTTEIGEFTLGLNTLFDVGMSFDNFFGSKFMDLNAQNIIDFQAGLGGN